jgi:hypothetical protein
VRIWNYGKSTFRGQRWGEKFVGLVNNGIEIVLFLQATYDVGLYCSYRNLLLFLRQQFVPPEHTGTRHFPENK